MHGTIAALFASLDGPDLFREGGEWGLWRHRCAVGIALMSLPKFMP